MLNKKEIAIIIVAALILALSLSLMDLTIFLNILLAIFLVLIINIFAKKISSYYLDSEIEIKLWEVQKYWFRKNDYLKKPFPLGAFLPIISSGLTLGYVVWMAPLIFDVRAKTYRSAKRFGLYKFSEMTEYHIGLIATAGILANLIFAVIGYLIGFETFSKLNIYFAFYNMIPLSNLDGNKIFFGSLIMWSFLAALTLLGLAYAILII